MKNERLPLHKDTYFFGYGIDIEKPIDIANKNIELQQENKQLQEELKFTIGIVEHNRIISGKNKEIHQLKDNWNELKEWVKEQPIFNYLAPVDIKNKMQELERESDKNE